MPTEGVQKPEPVKTVESAAGVLRERIDREIMERLERLDQRLSALEKRLERGYAEAERLEKGAEEELLPAPSLLRGVDADKLMKIISSSEDPFKAAMTFILVQESLQTMRLNSLLLHERMEELLERRRKRESEDTVSRHLERLEKAIESRTGTQLSAQDLIALYKEIQNTVKEIKSAVPAIDEEKLVARITSEVEKKLAQGQGMSVKDALGLVKETMEGFKSIVMAAKELVPQPQPPQASTTSASPLMYQGAAPWYWHPDARVAIKEFVEAARGIGETIKDIVLAIKAPETQIVKASKPAEAPKPALPSELSLG
jgi:Rad3-related DNA helicase